MNRLTYNPIIWLQYGCWNISRWLQTHRPNWPLKVRGWAFSKYGPERYGANWAQIRWWQQNLKDYKLIHRPLPWWLGPNAMRPIPVDWLWSKAERLFRSFTGGRSHRCEFTDPDHGALYGHKEGAFMDRLFDQFLKNIDGGQ